jgi:hypothetical protein
MLSIINSSIHKCLRFINIYNNEWGDKNIWYFRSLKACAVAKGTWILEFLISSKSFLESLASDRGSSSDAQRSNRVRWWLRAAHTLEKQRRCRISTTGKRIFPRFVYFQAMLNGTLIFHRENSPSPSHAFPTFLTKRRLHKFNLTFICYSSIRCEFKNRQRKLFQQQKQPSKKHPLELCSSVESSLLLNSFLTLSRYHRDGIRNNLPGEGRKKGEHMLLNLIRVEGKER